MTILQACKNLLQHYEKVVQNNANTKYNCDLCDIINCHSCPWVTLERTNCTDEMKEVLCLEPDSKIKFTEIRNNKKWAKHRIPMLKRWIKHYEQEN
jgi:hypothetical protein